MGRSAGKALDPQEATRFPASKAVQNTHRQRPVHTMRTRNRRSAWHASTKSTRTTVAHPPLPRKRTSWTSSGWMTWRGAAESVLSSQNAVWEDAARHGCAAVCMALSAQQPRHRRSSSAAGSNLWQRTSCHAETLPPGQPPTHSPATRSPPSSPPASPIPIHCNLPAAMHALPPKGQPPTHLHLLHQGGQVHRLALGGRGSRLRQGRLRRQGGSLAEGRCMRARSVSSWESVQRCKQGDLHLQWGGMPEPTLCTWEWLPLGWRRCCVTAPAACASSSVTGSA